MSLLRRIERGGQGPDDPGDGGEQSKLAQAQRRRTQVPQPGGAAVARTDSSNYQDLKVRIQNKLLAELDTSVDPRSPEVRTTIEELFATILSEESIILGRAERQKLFEAIVAEILGFGPLETLLARDEITEIMVNGPKNVYIETEGNLLRSNVTFEDEDHVLRVLDRIVAPLGRRIDESSPTVDARLPDGSRVNAVIRPIALCGPTITIRKFSKRPFTVEDLIRFGSMTPEIA
ncbi:MAG: CpaF family protein, partial [Anaerolineae bacterium]|nr:CpaF family protein [Anaerolineae bacterium]